MKEYKYLQEIFAKVSKHSKAIAGLVLLFGVVIVLYFSIGSGVFSKKEEPKKRDFRSALEDSVGGTDPKPLQDFFVKNIKEGVNDKNTKSAIYWITHRFFDNGGNIYEIYDFVNAHPEVAFLKEAELLYPTVFAKIKANQVKDYSGESLLALVAYYEIIDKHGYASLAMWGIAANKTSEFAYGAMLAHRANPKKKYGPQEVSPLVFKSDMLKKSIYFVTRINAYLKQATLKTGTLQDLYQLDMIPDDLLVGLNQYGSAIENLKGTGMVVSTQYSPAKLYEFNVILAQDRVPRLYFFTNYLYATSLVYGNDATKVNVKEPLDRAIKYAKTTEKPLWRKSVSRVIDSKTSGEKSMYKLEVVRHLAILHPDFKMWLMENGWKETDFK